MASMNRAQAPAEWFGQLTVSREHALTHRLSSSRPNSWLTFLQLLGFFSVAHSVVDGGKQQKAHVCVQVCATCGSTDSHLYKRCRSLSLSRKMRMPTEKFFFSFLLVNMFQKTTLPHHAAPSEVSSSRQRNNLTLADVQSDAIARIAEKHFSSSWDPQVVENIFKNELEPSLFSARKLLLLEYCQYLEKVIYERAGRETRDGKLTLAFFACLTVLVAQLRRKCIPEPCLVHLLDGQ